MIILDEVDFVKNFTTDFTIRSFNINKITILSPDVMFIKQNVRLGFWLDAINCPYTNILEQVQFLIYILRNIKKNNNFDSVCSSADCKCLKARITFSYL